MKLFNLAGHGGGVLLRKLAGQCGLTAAPEAALAQRLNRDELYVNLGCLRKCAQVTGI